MTREFELTKENVLPLLFTVWDQREADWAVIEPLIEMLVSYVRTYNQFGPYATCDLCGVGSSTNDTDHKDYCQVRRAREFLVRLYEGGVR